MAGGPPPVVVIGHGGMGGLYARALRDAGMLAGVAVGSERSRQRWADQLDEPVSSDAAALVAELQPAAVCVMSPTHLHAEHLRLGLARGAAGLVIKPACVHPDEAEALRAEAAAAGATVTVAHEGVFQPALVALVEAVRAGRIGDVREVRWLKEGGETLSGGRTSEPPKPEDVAGRNLGYVYATTMHELYVANRLAGRTAPVASDVTHVHAGNVHPRLDATARYADGLICRIRYNGDPALPFRRGLHVVGSHGSALWLVQPGRTTLQVDDGRGARDLPFEGHGTTNPATPVVAAWRRVLDGEIAPPEDLLDGARALRAARLLTAAAARCADLEVDLDAVAGAKAAV